MRQSTIVAAVLTAIPILAATAPLAEAAKKHTRLNAQKASYEECAARAQQRGVPPGQNGHREFMTFCQSGAVVNGGKNR